MELKKKGADWSDLYLGWLLLAIAAGCACALAGTYWFGWPPLLPDNPEAEKFGQMGDFFGGMLNPLVSALTLFVAISVWQLQKKELKATQKALDEQAKTAEQQRQEQRFFDLLNVYQQTVGSVVLIAQMSTTADVPVHYTGKEAVAHFLRRDNAIWTEFNKKGTAHFFESFEVGYIKLKNRDDLLMHWNSETIASLFDHYFRVIFRILTEAEGLLSNQQIPDLKDQHFRYIKLFRAQLSRSELIILGFNLWLDDEGKKMLPLAEKYGLLKHLPTGHLRTELEKLHPKVFGRTRAQSLQTLPPNQPEASL